MQAMEERGQAEGDEASYHKWFREKTKQERI